MTDKKPMKTHSKKAQPEPFDLRSKPVGNDKRTDLLRLFPEAKTEGDKLDFDRLKLALGESVDVGKERYGMTWPGKAECFKTIQRPSLGTLRPAPKESVNFENSENLIVEGDNLEVLKLLQRSYLGKVKVIYIDPPYNTGNDFIYPDDFTESLQTYLQYTGQADTEGRRFGTNTDTGGRFHSKWLNMMYPRLYLARTLLRDDGVVFISIDDNEVTNLRRICDEIFGEENFIAQITWEGAGKNDARQIGVSHEYVIVYARSRAALPPTWTVAKNGVEPILREAERLRAEHGKDFDSASEALAAWYRANKATPSFAHRRFRFIDKNGVYKEDDPTAPGGRHFDLLNPRTRKVIPLREGRGWGFDQAKFEQMVAEGRISFISPTSIMVRRYLHETDRYTPQSVIYQPARSASERLEKLMGGAVFDFPKDETVLRQFVDMATSAHGGDIVLDFFAGSGATAHSVLELNNDDGGDRKFILVQLPEPVSSESDAGRMGFKTIADIAKERVRRAAKKILGSRPKQLELKDSHKKKTATSGDFGFKVFKLAESNFLTWNADGPHDADALMKQLALHVDHVRKGRSSADILAELLLKSGFSLTVPVESLALAGKEVYSISGGALIVCLENELSLALIRAIAEKKPERVVCLDQGFAGADQLKANAVQIFKTKGITSFKTV